jgi:outer membrane protein assembly factor BamE
MSDLPFRSVRLSLLLAAAASLAACGAFDSASNRAANVLTPYKVDVVQGNFVSAEQVAAIKPGMSRLQVRDILGTPLLTSVFHADRWDYVFTFRRQGVAPQARKATVYFKGDAMDRIEADAMPTEAEFVASLDSGRKTGKVPLLELPPDALSQRPIPAQPTNAKALPPLPASYPPLEASP